MTSAADGRQTAGQALGELPRAAANVASTPNTRLHMKRLAFKPAIVTMDERKSKTFTALAFSDPRSWVTLLENFEAHKHYIAYLGRLL